MKRVGERNIFIDSLFVLDFFPKKVLKKRRRCYNSLELIIH